MKLRRYLFGAPENPVVTDMDEVERNMQRGVKYANCQHWSIAIPACVDDVDNFIFTFNMDSCGFSFIAHRKIVSFETGEGVQCPYTIVDALGHVPQTVSVLWPGKLRCDKRNVLHMFVSPGD
jgi:hypothetical protein